MKLLPENKFFIENENDGSLILINEIVLNPEIIKMNYLEMKGIRFDVDYDADKIRENGEVEVSISFNIEYIVNKEED
jgi:hypothetical protein